MKVTKELIEKGMTGSGGWTRRQLEILGETWPPESGWKDRAVGREITSRQQAEFIAIKHKQTAKLEKKRGREPITMPTKEQVTRVVSAALRGAQPEDTPAIAQTKYYFEQIYGEL